MKTYGMPEKFWVVTKPSPVSELADVCFPCTFERLLLQGQGGLDEDDIRAFRRRSRSAGGGAAALGEISRPSRGRVFADVVVHVMRNRKARDDGGQLGEAAVEAVLNAVHVPRSGGTASGCKTGSPCARARRRSSGTCKRQSAVEL